MAGRLERALYPLYRRLERRAVVLRYLFLEITQRCNLACRHCGSDCGSHGRPDELGPEEWVALLDRLAGALDRRRVVLVITGGEPLCAPGLEPILAAVARHGFAWGMVSNGWALDREVARQAAGPRTAIAHPEPRRLRGRARLAARSVRLLRPRGGRDSAGRRRADPLLRRGHLRAPAQSRPAFRSTRAAGRPRRTRLAPVLHLSARPRPPRPRGAPGR